MSWVSPLRCETSASWPNMLSEGDKKSHDRPFSASPCLYRSPVLGGREATVTRVRTTQDTRAQAARYRKAVGDTRLQSSPAMLLATILPKLCTVASRPKADPRRSVGARTAA